MPLEIQVGHSIYFFFFFCTPFPLGLYGLVQKGFFVVKWLVDLCLKGEHGHVSLSHLKNKKESLSQ